VAAAATLFPLHLQVVVKWSLFLSQYICIYIYVYIYWQNRSANPLCSPPPKKNRTMGTVSSTAQTPYLGATQDSTRGIQERLTKDLHPKLLEILCRTSATCNASSAPIYFTLLCNYYSLLCADLGRQSTWSVPERSTRVMWSNVRALNKSNVK